MSLSNNCGLCRKHYKDKRAASASAECDCGAPAMRDGVCDRCLWLDGNSLVEAEVIRYLQAGPATIKSVANACGYTERHLYRALRVLRGSGRVSLIGSDGDAYDVGAMDSTIMPFLVLRERGAPRAAS